MNRRGASARPQGSETILVAEDTDDVRALIRRVLSRRGYRVLDARSGSEAIELYQRHKGAISLLLTDVILPGGMNGRELGERLTLSRPEIKIIYMSGYASDTITHCGDHFLQKPFTLEGLARKVREVLDSKGC